MKYLCLSFLLWIPYLLSSQSIDSSAIKEIDSLIQVSQKLTSKNDFDKALEVNIIAEKLVLKKFGKESASYGNVCNNKGKIYYSKGEYAEAEKIYIEAKFVREKILGNDHLDYAGTLINLAILYSKLSKFEEAEQLLLTAKSIFEIKIENTEKPFYINCLNNLANLYSKFDQLDKAETLYLKSKVIAEKLYGKKHLDYARILQNLALLYIKIGKMDEAEILYLEVKSIYKEILNIADPRYLKFLNNLANFYVDLGEYDKAESIFYQVKDNAEKVFGKESSEYANFLESQAILYQLLINFDKAEFLYLKSKDIREKVLGKEHPDYSSSLNNLAILYEMKGQFNNAETFYLEAASIRGKVFGKNHSQYASSIINLGNLYCIMGQFEKAKTLLTEANEINEKLFGKENPAYQAGLTNLANVFYMMGNYKIAESLYIESKTYLEKLFGNEHPDYIKSLTRLIYLYEKQCRYFDSDLLINEIIEISNSKLLKSVGFFSEIELTKYLTIFNAQSDELLAFLYFRPQSLFGKAPAYLYNNILFYKGFLLVALAQMNNHTILCPQSIKLNNQLRSYKRTLVSEYSKPILERKGVFELEEMSNQLEKELAHLIVGYGQNTRQLNWQEVRNKLELKDAAVEFIHFKFNDKNQTDSFMYAALVLLPNDTTPHFVPLFEEKKLNQLLSNSQSRRMDYVAEVYRFANDNSDTLSLDQNKSLYELIWKPLEAYLKGVNKIYFSPSGLLYRINQNVIAINDQTLLSDKYDLVQLGSTRQLVTNEGVKEAKILNASIYGGINFELDSVSLMATHHEVDTNGIALRSELSFSYTDSTLRGGSWNYLNGSEQEANEINKIIHKAGIKSSLFKGNDATEEAFKKLGDYKTESPQVIHISTHGYFFPDPKISRQSSVLSLQEEPVFKMSEHPMLRSGLIMAGANHAWKTGKPITPEAEDGILTAYEISQLNLRNTELVVLSACETGLGDIQGNEGVYGLQRAFKIAGAKNLIMSLWQVPDQQTSELMTAFYKYWLIKKKSIRESLKLAQNDLRKKGLESFYWAGFVLVE